MIYPLLNFRLAYLRAIAKSWSEPEFKNILLEKDILDPDIQAEYPDLKDLFGALDLGDISVKITDNSNDQTLWNVSEPGKWVGPNDLFLIYLPVPPEETMQVEALAAYYEIFPTIFGTALHIPGQLDKPICTDAGGETDPFLRFGGVTLHTIALAWKNNDFFKKLANSELEDATHLLNKNIGFNSPWNFYIQFQEQKEFTWNGNSWENIPKNLIQLNYPCKPEDSSLMPLALTAYNETGPQYPFTCS